MLGRMRQTMFDVLQGEVRGRAFADLYAGTGAVGIEALSRGAARAVFVESEPRAVEVIRSNLRAVGAEGRGTVWQGRVQDVLPRITADIFFAGPPYEAVTEYGRTLRALSRLPLQVAIAQHASRLELEASYGSLERVRVVRVGGNRLSLYRPAG